MTSWTYHRLVYVGDLISTEVSLADAVPRGHEYRFISRAQPLPETHVHQQNLLEKNNDGELSLQTNNMKYVN